MPIALHLFLIGDAEEIAQRFDAFVQARLEDFVWHKEDHFADGTGAFQGSADLFVRFRLADQRFVPNLDRLVETIGQHEVEQLGQAQITLVEINGIVGQIGRIALFQQLPEGGHFVVFPVRTGRVELIGLPAQTGGCAQWRRIADVETHGQLAPATVPLYGVIFGFQVGIQNPIAVFTSLQQERSQIRVAPLQGGKFRGENGVGAVDAVAHHVGERRIAVAFGVKNIFDPPAFIVGDAGVGGAVDPPHQFRHGDVQLIPRGATSQEVVFQGGGQLGGVNIVVEIAIHRWVFVDDRQVDAILLAHINAGQRPLVIIGVDHRGQVIIIATIGPIWTFLVGQHLHRPDHAHLVGSRPGTGGAVGNVGAKGDAPTTRCLGGGQIAVAI